MVQYVPTIAIGLLLVAALPVWPWSRGWGWAPAGILAMGLATLVTFQFVAIEPEL